jgi:hypothetical protein
MTSVRCIAKMGKVEKIEREIKELSAEEMTELREWFAAFDAEARDRRFEPDVRAGKLDALADRALKAHATGQTSCRPLFPATQTRSPGTPRFTSPSYRSTLTPFQKAM